MIVDTSAIVAVLQGESDADDYVRAFSVSTSTRIAPGTLVELSVVMWRRFGASESDVRAALSEFGIRVADDVPGQHWAAAAAYRRFGPGAPTGARLNFGDCFAYALASLTQETLLFKGDDFHATDVRPALARVDDPGAGSPRP